MYCGNIFKDGLTCKEFADKVSSRKTYANDPICKKYRNKYKHDEISGSDFEKWIDWMKIRK